MAKKGREGTPGHEKVGTSQDRPMETHRIGNAEKEGDGNVDSPQRD